MLTNFKVTTLKAGLFALALSIGACSSSTPANTTGNGGHGAGAGTNGAAGTTGAAGTGGTTGAAGTNGGAGSDGGAAGSDGGAAGSDGGAAGSGSDGGESDGGLTPLQMHTAIINADTTGGVAITRAMPKDYNTCK
jgi:hypothetical protein